MIGVNGVRFQINNYTYEIEQEIVTKKNSIIKM